MFQRFNPIKKQPYDRAAKLKIGKELDYLPNKPVSKLHEAVRPTVSAKAIVSEPVSIIFIFSLLIIILCNALPYQLYAGDARSNRKNLTSLLLTFS